MYKCPEVEHREKKTVCPDKCEEVNRDKNIQGGVGSILRSIGND